MAEPLSPAGPAPIRRARSHAELLAAVGATPGDAAFVRYELPTRLPGPCWILGSSALCYRRSHSRRDSLVGLGDPAQLVDLFAAVSGTGAVAGLRSATVPRAGLELIGPRLTITGPGGDWDWMYAEGPPPPQAAESGMCELDDAADAQELAALNERGNPTAESYPGTGRTELWIGAKDAGGAIIAAGALHRTPAGAGHLSGIVVDPAHRGRGLGAAVTAALTRAAMERPGRFPGVCTLGMYARNDTARRLYRRLGYRTAQAFASRPVAGF